MVLSRQVQYHQVRASPMPCLSDVLPIPALLAEDVEGEGLTAGSDGMTVLLSDLPARWEGQASTLWSKVTLAGEPRVLGEPRACGRALPPRPGHGSGGISTCCWRLALLALQRQMLLLRD